MFQIIINKLNSYRIESQVSSISQKVKRSRLTYLTNDKIANIETSLKDITKNSVPGICIEAGIALGGSAIVIASLMPTNACFHGYDVFEMIPPPTEEDDEKSKTRYEVIKSGNSKGIGNELYYGYIKNLYEQVVKNFESFDLEVDGKYISLHKGLFEETMNFTAAEKIAFAHIDCDWYQSVKFCLEKIYPVLSSKGYIVLDDYHDYGGCKKAVHEFLATRTDMTIITGKGNLVLMRE